MQRLSTAVVIVSVCGLTGGVSLAQDVRNEGAGEHRAEMDAMLYKPAPISFILAEPHKWIGEEPTAAELNGKPVLIVYWAEWYRPSHAALMLANRLHKEFADQGLVVIGVHDSNGWEDVASFVEKRRVTIPIAFDAEGAVWDRLGVDQEPDFYVIDRAGNMRFADITTDSVRRAVEIVVGENASEAANAKQNQTTAAREAEAARRRAGSINQSVSLDNLPSIPFTEPTAEQYASTDWPKFSKEELEKASSYEELTPPFAVPDGDWIPKKPDTKGKIIVAYTWHPADRVVTNELMVKLDDLQKQRARDVVVMGFLVPISDQRGRNRRGLVRDEFNDLPISSAGIKTALGDRETTQYLMASPSGNPIPSTGGRRQRRNDNVVGQVVVVSTDGRVRRSTNLRDWGTFKQALDQLLREDPGVKARRAAEERYIRGNGG